jgi:hypothetical protein
LVSDVESNNFIGGPGSGNGGESTDNEDPLDYPIDEPDQPGFQCDENEYNPLQCDAQSP